MKKHAIFGLSFIALIAVFSFKLMLAPNWTVDKAHSSIGFEITHFFTPVKGSFTDFTGTLAFDPSDLGSSKVDFTVNIASVNTGNKKRDSHLQSKDFFNVKKWSTMKFTSTSIKKSGSNYVAVGKLTIRDVTKSIEIPFKVLGVQDHPMKKGNLVTAIRAEFSIDRTKFGVGTGSWSATAVVGDNVDITVLLEASRKK